MGKREKIAVDLKFAKDAALGLPLVTIVGNSELVVENFKSIVHYESDCIRLMTKQGYVSVEGSCLIIKYYNDEEIAVKGRICKIEYF
ncbi:MAG: YabP/YqfC family sporulation protein [Lachnospira sp.]|nr:YabP/YqfC family sporulation protein [Lachnospira sp.]